MKFLKAPISLLMTAALLWGLTLPAAASEAMGEDLSKKDIPVHEQTQLSTNVFWSTTYSDLRTENLITYTPNRDVTPIVTYGETMTSCTSVAAAAKALEEQDYRVVAGINGDFYNTGNGLPIGVVITDGLLRSSDAGYYAIGFRSDGSAIIGKPGISVSVDLGYAVDNGYGGMTELVRTVTAVNKARVSSGGIYLYTYDFNDRHTTGTTDPGVNVLCTITSGEVAIGEKVTAQVEEVFDGPGATPIEPDQIVLSVHGEANSYYVNALRNIPQDAEITVTVSANDGWDEAEYAVGALYSLVERGALKQGLPAGANPRTAIGVKADGTVVFYTMDGRRDGYSIGSSLAQVGSRMMELGCVDVLGLDGGGSTNLVVTTPDSTTATIFNRPSESNRKVTNQIFLVASNRPSGSLHHFYVSADNDFVLAGSTVKITASAVDSNYIPMDRSFSLSASAGILEDGILTTPDRGGDVTVTASNGSKRGQTTVHVIKTPDAITVKNGGSAVSSLTVTPGGKVALSAEAVWNHLALKADPEAFAWRVNGNIGTIDELGRFTASAPGEGSITVSAGGTSVTIPVAVTRVPLKTLDSFEKSFASYSNETPSGMLTLSHNTQSEYVQMGRGSLRLDYRLMNWAGCDLAGYTISAPYHTVNLWVYGDNSGNELIMSTNSETQPDVVACVLDFSGWKQVSVTLPDDAAQVEALSVRGITELVTDAVSGETMEIAKTPRTGTIYIDQMVASFDGVMDDEAPVIAAELDSNAGVVRAKISDRVDGILPAGSVVATYNGSTLTAVSYDNKTGLLTVQLPEMGEEHEAARVTVMARDASGNIGRASVDVDPVGVSHKFTDVNNYWAATYVDFLYTAGVTTGYADGSFRPNQNITRAQFAVMLYRYLGLSDAAYANVKLPFADLNQIGDYAIPAIKALYSEGIITGSMKNGKMYFNPNSALTRAQAATMIGRTQEKGYACVSLTFRDASKIPAYATYYIQTMVAQGIIGGYADGSFKPNNNITRGQMAKILYNLM